MRHWLIYIRNNLWDSFWFLPSVMAVGAGLLAFFTVWLDRVWGHDIFKALGWVWAGSPDGARAMLSAVAGSVMTVVSIVFSLTLSTLAQTSSQFGPRVLRNFTSDRGNQATLGIFIATFVYCLLVLRTVRSVDENQFVPYMSVNLGIGMALASLGVLIWFIHRIAHSIQLENIVAEIGHDFEGALDRLFPEHIGREIKPAEKPDWEIAPLVFSHSSGYLQSIDTDFLMNLARQHDVILRIEKKPGEFVARGGLLMRVSPPSRAPEDLRRRFSNAFAINAYRTPQQDASYSIQQLTEIAGRALSPGVNEPFTAISCIDWIGACLQGVAERPEPSPYRYDENDQLRVVAPITNFEELARSFFDPTRVYGASTPDVAAQMLDCLHDLAPHVQRENDRQCLRQHAQLIIEDAGRELKQQSDQERIARHGRRALLALARTQTAPRVEKHENTD